MPVTFRGVGGGELIWLVVTVPMGLRKGKVMKKSVRGEVGEKIFAEVQRLTEAEKISRSDAFRRIAKERGSSVGSVAVNFYRVANIRGLKLRGRGPRKVGARKAGRPGRGKVATSGKAEALLRELGRLIEHQAKELDALRQENARYDEIRRLLK